MNEINGYYAMSIHPTSLNVYYQSLSPRKHPLDDLFDPEELEAGRKLMPKQFKDNLHHGKISKVARRKITRSIDYMVAVVPHKKNIHPYYDRSSEFQLNFITLTLSSEQIHSDNEIKTNILEPFLNTCRQKWKIVSYLWRAEKQENGNIHFHLITDHFIPWNELRNVWNKHQERHGYITRYRDNQTAWHRDGFRYRPDLEKSWPKAKQLQAYQDGIRHDWHNPNSTDVHALRFINNVKAYAAKYIIKDDQSSEVKGRLWGCSSNLVDLRGGVAFAEGSVSDELSKLMNESGTRTYKADYFSIIYFDLKRLYSGEFPELLSIYQEFIFKRFPQYRQPTLI